jgi:hypothetical protein
MQLTFCYQNKTLNESAMQTIFIGAIVTLFLPAYAPASGCAKRGGDQ